jgi:hypothetical protein
MVDSFFQQYISILFEGMYLQIIAITVALYWVFASYLAIKISTGYFQRARKLQSRQAP